MIRNFGRERSTPPHGNDRPIGSQFNTLGRKERRRNIRVNHIITIYLSSELYNKVPFLIWCSKIKVKGLLFFATRIPRPTFSFVGKVWRPGLLAVVLATEPDLSTSRNPFTLFGYSTEPIRGLILFVFRGSIPRLSFFFLIFFVSFVSGL